MPPEITPAQPPQPAPQPVPIPPTPPLKQIRTFQGDVADALARQNESLYSIQAGERAKRGYVQAEPAVRSTLPLLAGSFLLISLAGLGGWLAYGEYVRKTTVPAPIAPVSRFLSAESTREIDATSLTRDTLLLAISDAASGTKEGELRHIVMRKGLAPLGGEMPLLTSADFLQILGTNAPGSLVRSFDPVFMVGALGQSRFMIFKLLSFPNAFGGMLGWEKDVASDVGGFLAPSDALKSIGPASVFKDVIYRNKDARVLYDLSGATSTASTSSPQAVPAMLYSFFDNRMLIITDHLETLQTLIDRLTRDSLVR